MTPIAKHITAFLRERLPVQRGASPHTCESYAYTFQLLFQFASNCLKTLPSKLYLEQIDAQMVMDFLSHIETVRKAALELESRALPLLNLLCVSLNIECLLFLNKVGRILAIPSKKSDSPLIGYLSMIEMQAILNAPDIKTKAGIRDRAMLHLCFSAGLRVSELTGLLLNAITFQPIPSIQVMGKGRKERSLPLWKQAATDLRAWMAVRGNIPTPELFINARGEPLTRAGVTYLLRKYAQMAGKTCASLRGKQISPHVLRHTCAMTILQATGDIRKVSLWLGHAHMQTTEIYLRADPTEKIEAIEGIMPMSLRRGKFESQIN